MKNNVYRIKEDYTTDITIPIILNIGDIVKLGEEAKEEQWKGWIYATKDGIEGYVPMQIIEFLEDKKYGKIKEDYTAKEINVKSGDEVIKIKSLNGWAWVRKTNEEGWIPEEVMADKNI